MERRFQMARYVVLALSVALCSAGQGATGQDVVARALDLASTGRMDDGLELDGVGAGTVGSFIRSADLWLANRVDKDTGYLLVSALALELLFRSTQTSSLAAADGWSVGVDWSNAINGDERDWSGTRLTNETAQFPVVAWACDLMSRRRGSPQADLDWWLASVGILENARSWRALVGVREDDPRRAKTLKTPVGRDIIEGHLVHARARVSTHPRLALAEAVAQSMLEFKSFEPSARGRPSVLRSELPFPSASVIRAAVSRFESLKNLGEGVAAEAEVWIGYLELRRNRWESALARFDHAKRAVADDTFLSAVLNYLAGWTNEQLGRHEASIAAYSDAASDFPRVRNLSTLLAAQLYLRGDRERAYQILREALTTPKPQLDLITQFERGDARRVRGYLDRVRGSIR